MPFSKLGPSLALAGALFISTQALAQITIQDAWVRATVPQQKATGAFMRITAAQDSRLVSVSSPVSGVAEIHEMKLEGDVMRMRAVPALELAAGKPVELKPGGYHLMLMDLKQPISSGSNVALTLTFEAKDGQRHTQEVQAPVRALNAVPAKSHDAHGGGHGSHGGHGH